MSKDAAIKDFEAKFRAKSGNAWADRANFKPKGGKYTLIEIAYDDDDQAAKLAEAEKAGKGTSISQADLEKAKEDEEFAESELEPHVAKLMELIFNKNMFVNAMQAFEIDTKRMPLGNLSMNQVNQGFAVLEDLGAAIKRGDSRQMQDLSSRFFTVIPHAFGRNVPPVINNAEMLQKKKDMLNVLSDIEKALQLEKRARTRSANRKKVKKELKPNPLDEKYETLNTELTYVDPKSDEFKKIDTYMANTKSRAMSIIDVFRVDRNDSKYLDNNAKCDNRVLLWHGTNVAVVSAILSSGLRMYAAATRRRARPPLRPLTDRVARALPHTACRTLAAASAAASTLPPSTASRRGTRAATARSRACSSSRPPWARRTTLRATTRPSAARPRALTRSLPAAARRPTRKSTRPWSLTATRSRCPRASPCRRPSTTRAPSRRTSTSSTTSTRLASATSSSSR